MPNDQTTPPGEPTLSISQLAEQAGVTRRTVHYYIAQGLLPASGLEGRGTKYGQGHLNRLRLIRQLQREHLPLAGIRQRLEHLTDSQISALLAAGVSEPDPRGSAFDYIQSVLSGANRRAVALTGEPAPPLPGASLPARPAPAAAAPAAPATPGAPALPVRTGAMSPAPRIPGVAGRETANPRLGDPPPTARTEPVPTGRSQWERISLAPDIELHVRRPLGRYQNRAVDRLIGLARQLLEGDSR